MRGVAFFFLYNLGIQTSTLNTRHSCSGIGMSQMTRYGLLPAVALNTVHMFVLFWQTSELTVAFPPQRQILVDTKLQRELKHRYLKL